MKEQKADWEKELPMGVSKWREIGKKYGYWDYFAEKERQAERERCIKLIKRLRCEKCFSDHWQRGFEMAKTVVMEAIKLLNQ